MRSPTADTPRFTRGHHLEVIDRSPKFGSTLAQVTLSRCGRSEPPRAVRCSRVSRTCLKHALPIRPTPRPPPIVSYGPQQSIPPLSALRDASAAKVDHTKSCVRARRVRADKKRCLADADARTRLVRNSWRVSNGRCCTSRVALQ